MAVTGYDRTSLIPRNAVEARVLWTSEEFLGPEPGSCPFSVETRNPIEFVRMDCDRSAGHSGYHIKVDHTLPHRSHLWVDDDQYLTSGESQNQYVEAVRVACRPVGRHRKEPEPGQ